VPRGNLFIFDPGWIQLDVSTSADPVESLCILRQVDVSRYVHPSEDTVLNAITRLGGHKIGHSENDAAQLPVAKDATSTVN
jgi:hypothetical protein